MITFCSGLVLCIDFKISSPEQKVIMVSAVGQDMVIEEALQNGAKAYIVKPFEEANVLSVVEKVSNEE